MRKNLFVILKHVQHFHNHFPLKTKDNKLCFCYAGFVQKYENKQKKWQLDSNGWLFLRTDIITKHKMNNKRIKKSSVVVVFSVIIDMAL